MEKNYKSCNFLYSDVKNASVQYNPPSLRIKRRFRELKWFIFSIYSIFPQIFSREKSMKGINSKFFSHSSENDTLNLQPGEWVEVRPIDEISVTLDDKGKFKGLYFMPEMEKFCGKKFKVFKKAEIIKLESTGEVRKLRSPSIFLEGVYCNGERHEGCDRACFHFWRETWLKRIHEKL